MRFLFTRKIKKMDKTIFFWIRRILLLVGVSSKFYDNISSILLLNFINYKRIIKSLQNFFFKRITYHCQILCHPKYFVPRLENNNCSKEMPCEFISRRDYGMLYRDTIIY